MEIFKSIFDSKITTNNERIKFLWDLIVDYWGEINSVGYLRTCLKSFRK
ncbi:MAG: hypothetical protein PPFGHCPK_01487 (plasmid) [Spiroplasma endosymbiont of Drosophila atripex]|nr:MAG: hypothetical protein PPFGHCPK_01487 [Spiroplasma endosymbiont of Drosophila atripex]